jgi:4-hydroxy-tetrahydrodipicolinate reductase
MRIALFGAGAMGQLVAARAKERDDDVGLVLTSRDASRNREDLIELLRGHGAAIDFSVAGAVLGNVTACAIAGVPLVEGTTGWTSSVPEVCRIVEQHGGALLYGANFSVGVNLFYRIVSNAAELFRNVEGYAPFIEEAHHMRKRDAPSGTALLLRDLLKPLNFDVPIASTRAGYIPGTHIVGFDSAADQITLKHLARNREGFAAGALVAAHWLVGRKGIYEFSEMIDEVLTGKAK